jgi:phage shock protein PspC (stress-responsive transcriptional regulator)
MSNLDKSNAAVTPVSSGFRLDKHNAKVFGVCSGIAKHFGIDPLIVRLGFVIGGFLSVGTAALVYIAIALIVD